MRVAPSSVRSIDVVAKPAKNFAAPDSESLGDFRYIRSRTRISRTILKHGNGFLMVALASLAITGCGGKDDVGPSLTPVSGTVTLDGEPLPDADIVFHFKGSKPEKYVGASSRSDSEGRFQVKSGKQLGIIPGRHKVTVARSNSDAQPEVPEKYSSLDTTDLELEAKSDVATGYVLKLTSTTQ